MNPAAPPTPLATQRRFPLPILLLGLTAAWTVLWFVHTLGYWEDDAYIHLEFARSVARGHGFAFNGHVVYGDTSPLWVFLLVLFHLVLPDSPQGWMIAGKALTAAACVFALTGIFRFAASLTRELGFEASRRFAAAALLVLVVNPYFGYWAFSGMEALAAAGLACWGLWAATGISPAALTPQRYLLGCVCAGLAPLLRPEMLFFTVLLGLVLFVRWVNLPALFGDKLRLFFGGYALVAGPTLLWGAYAFHAFGTLLPNTNAAKRAGPADSVLRHLLGIYSFGFPLVMLGVLLLAGALLLGSLSSQGRRGLTVAALSDSLDVGGWVLFAWTAVSWLFYLLDHTYVQTRYIFVTAPLLTIALLAMARKLAPRLYTAGLALGLAFGVLASFWVTWPLIRNKVKVDRQYAELAAVLRSLPANAPVAHYSIGEAGFLSEHPLVDLGGITRPGVLPFLFDPDDTRRVWWAHGEGARYMVLQHAPEPGSRFIWGCNLPATGWFLNPRRYRSTDRLELWQLPTVPTLPLPPNMPAADKPKPGLFS